MRDDAMAIVMCIVNIVLILTLISGFGKSFDQDMGLYKKHGGSHGNTHLPNHGGDRR